MATYSSSLVTNNVPIGSHGIAGNLKVVSAAVVCSSAPATTDTMKFFTLPKNAKVHLAVLKSTDMDTNGSPSITLNIGDAGSATRFFSASTVAQAGTLDQAIQVGGDEFQFSADTPIVGVAQANAATGAAGTVTLTMFYTLEGGAS